MVCGMFLSLTIVLSSKERSKLYSDRVVIVVRLKFLFQGKVSFHELSLQDIGGGSVSDKVPYSLARIPLRWMVRECFKSNTGILFYADKFPEIGMDPASVYHGDRPKPEPLMPSEQFRIESRDKDPLPIDHNKLLRDPRYDSLTTPKFLGEEEEELQDTMSAIYDELEIHPLWKIVEYLPLPYRYQTALDWEIGRR